LARDGYSFGRFVASRMGAERCDVQLLMERDLVHQCPKLRAIQCLRSIAKIRCTTVWPPNSIRSLTPSPLLEPHRSELMTNCRFQRFVLWSWEHCESLELSLSLWQAFTRRLSQAGDVAIRNSTRYRKLVQPEAGSQLDGIITRLTRRFGRMLAI
jgi:hypothetical protein